MYSTSTSRCAQFEYGNSRTVSWLRTKAHVLYTQCTRTLYRRGVSTQCLIISRKQMDFKKSVLGVPSKTRGTTERREGVGSVYFFFVDFFLVGVFFAAAFFVGVDFFAAAFFLGAAFFAAGFFLGAVFFAAGFFLGPFSSQLVSSWGQFSSQLASL